MDLPAIARRPFTEVDGSVGKVVLVYPPEKGSRSGTGATCCASRRVLQNIKLDNGKVIETSGFAVVFGAMIRSILHDGPIATVASLIAVLIIIVFTIRPAAAALMALATLMLGVLLMMGGAGLGAVHVTFLNFIALPITFGIGAEYALNVVTRYREERERLARRDLDGRGGRALLVDDDRRLRLAAGGEQPGAERLRPDGDHRRGGLPVGRDRRPAGLPLLAARPARSRKRPAPRTASAATAPARPDRDDPPSTTL